MWDVANCLRHPVFVAQIVLYSENIKQIKYKDVLLDNSQEITYLLRESAVVKFLSESKYTG